MGSVLTRRLGFSSLFQRKSKPRIKHGRRTREETSALNNIDIPLNGAHSVGELIPERYLVLLTEQMTEMLFRLMTCNETSMIISEDGPDQRASFGIGNVSVPMITPISNPNSPRSSLQLQSMHQSCIKCKMKTLTIEEFHELHNAFRRVDSDHDNFLTRDEIRTTLNYLFELTEYDIKEIISVFDTNKDDRISLEEYIGRKISF
jgi:hypothetical protein